MNFFFGGASGSTVRQPETQRRKRDDPMEVISDEDEEVGFSTAADVDNAVEGAEEDEAFSIEEVSDDFSEISPFPESVCCVGLD